MRDIWIRVIRYAVDPPHSLRNAPLELEDVIVLTPVVRGRAVEPSVRFPRFGPVVDVALRALVVRANDSSTLSLTTAF